MSVRVQLCKVCLASKSRCVCPYFHEPRIYATRFAPKVDRKRPNPFMVNVVNPHSTGA